MDCYCSYIEALTVRLIFSRWSWLKFLQVSLEQHCSHSELRNLFTYYGLQHLLKSQLWGNKIVRRVDEPAGNYYHKSETQGSKISRTDVKDHWELQPPWESTKWRVFPMAAAKITLGPLWQLDLSPSLVGMFPSFATSQLSRHVLTIGGPSIPSSPEFWVK